jgi:galactose oxidase
MTFISSAGRPSSSNALRRNSGTFTTTATDSVPRGYHSVSLLLPDARVLVGGGGLCGACDNNHADFAFYSPAYLFEQNGQPAARPSITSAPTTATYNTTIGVNTSATVTSFAFVRLGSVTHSVNNDQRRIPAAITTSTGNMYTVQTPADSGVATPGFYMLFAMNGAGVPSTAAIIRIQ